MPQIPRPGFSDALEMLRLPSPSVAGVDVVGPGLQQHEQILIREVFRAIAIGQVLCGADPVERKTELQ